jgi:phospholipid transport system substrate-binding protein
MKKIIGLLLCVYVMIPSLSVAAIDTKTPEYQFVSKVADEVMAAIKKGGGEKTIAAALQRTFAQYVDVQWVSQFVLGRHGRNASAQQKEDFVVAYKDFMVHSYAARLKNYAGETYKITSQRALEVGKSELRMEVARKGQSPIIIDYKVHKVDGAYKIYDMVVEGISLITTQRSEFDAVIERKGLDALIAALQKAKR